MNVALVGGTGLVGMHCLKRLVIQPEVKTVYSVGRRPLPEAIDKVMQCIGNADSYDSLLADLPIDAAVCCLGTTMRKAGSREAFEEVDLNLPLRFAKAVQKVGAKSFHVVSALGADVTSRHYYLRVKGVLENELKTIGFQTLHIYRPSLLLGDRDEFRLGERIAQSAYEKVERFYPSFLEKYKPIDAEKLARFITWKVKGQDTGIYVWDNATIHRSSV